jgi:hypothetical protein
MGAGKPGPRHNASLATQLYFGMNLVRLYAQGVKTSDESLMKFDDPLT